MKPIHKTKVVTSNFISDAIAYIQNLLGMNLTNYQNMGDEGIRQIQDELNNENVILEWYRYEISQLTNGALCIVLYGESKND